VVVPLVLDLAGTRCVIVGGGKVAERKLAALLRSGADLLVVAPEVTARIRNLVRRRRVRWRRALYRARHLAGARLALAATSDRGTNRRVARDAGRLGLFVNVADDPGLCTLVMPAVLRRGDLLVAVSTTGQSPALARSLRDDLAVRLGPEYGEYVRIVGSIRSRLLARVSDPRDRARRYRRLLRAPIRARLRSGRRREAWRAARRAAGLLPAGGTRDGSAS
jgi:precorrin-2 dehydrogenase/sirohydrochlorin ferrochelatase